MRITHQMLRLPLLALLTLSAGCLYRMPIQQGNVLDDIQISQLESGMTRSQVMFLLGTPMVPNGFNTDRWDYYYYINAGRTIKPISRRLSVYFKDDKVDRVDGDAASASKVGQPATAPAAAPAG